MATALPIPPHPTPFQAMPVERLMSRRLVTVGMDDSLEAIRRLLQKHGIHHLPVLDYGRLVGVISDRDVLRALSPALGTRAETTRDAATLNKRAHQIMTRALITLPPHATVAAAVALFRSKDLSCLPICDAQQRLQGLLSWRDLVRYLDTQFKAASAEGQ